MKDFLIGMGIGFAVGAVTCKLFKPMSNTIEKGVEKGKEILTDISDEIKAQTEKSKPNKTEDE